MSTDPGSFRDPAGVVVHAEGRVYRVVSPAGAAQYELARDSGLLSALIADGRLLPFNEADPRTLQDRIEGTVSHLLAVPTLDFISWPYEWPFPALRAAATLHLDIHLAALERGLTLADASAFNIQFQGTRPIFIDHLSFRGYREGEYWHGHRQFCEQFLNPLLLRAACGIPHHAWYRGSMSGIASAELSRVLPWYRKLSPLVFLHVILPDLMQRRHAGDPEAARPGRPLPRSSYMAMLAGLRRGIARLEARPDPASVWTGYAGNTSYRPEEAAAKLQFVREYVEHARPRVVWDLGCNTGDFAFACLDAGTELVIGFDSDASVVDRAWERASGNGRRFLPLFMDATNPSPSQGWREAERAGLARRRKPDGLLALALLHHLVIRHNIPMSDALDWMLGFAPTGVIEFVPKSDPMVRRLLALREDIFPDYQREEFLALIARKARIVRQTDLAPQGRTLIWYGRDD
jgi:ribosomal protein L11 methylase PrmA